MNKELNQPNSNRSVLHHCNELEQSKDLQDADVVHNIFIFWILLWIFGTRRFSARGRFWRQYALNRLPSPLSPNEFYLHMFHILKRFGKAAIAVELTAVGGLFYIFHEINTGGSEARSKWDDRLPFLIDAFYNMTGDERVIAHRTNRSKNDDN